MFSFVKTEHFWGKEKRTSKAFSWGMKDVSRLNIAYERNMTERHKYILASETQPNEQFSEHTYSGEVNINSPADQGLPLQPISCINFSATPLPKRSLWPCGGRKPTSLLGKVGRSGLLDDMKGPNSKLFRFMTTLNTYISQTRVTETFWTEKYYVCRLLTIWPFIRETHSVDPTNEWWDR